MPASHDTEPATKGVQAMPSRSTQSQSQSSQPATSTTQPDQHRASHDTASTLATTQEPARAASLQSQSSQSQQASHDTARASKPASNNYWLGSNRAASLPDRIPAGYVYSLYFIPVSRYSKAAVAAVTDGSGVAVATNVDGVEPLSGTVAVAAVRVMRRVPTILCVNAYRMAQGFAAIR
jgi:hypothetical protein